MIPTAMLPEGGRLYPVGRLDQDSEGLLVLTNDGAWADRVLHPRHGIEREYAIGLRAPLSRPGQGDQGRHPARRGARHVTGLRATTEIETRRLIELISPPPGNLTWYRAILAQGWKRQLRRMFGAVGAPIDRWSVSGWGRSASTSCRAVARAGSGRRRSVDWAPGQVSAGPG